MAVTGYGGSVKLGATGGTNVVSSVKTWELPLAAAMEDVSVMGSNFKQFVPTLIEATAKADVILDPTDSTGQIAIQNAILAGTLLICNFYTTGSHYYSASAYVKAMNIKDDVKAVALASLELQLTGTISYT